MLKIHITIGRVTYNTPSPSLRPFPSLPSSEAQQLPQCIVLLSCDIFYIYTYSYDQNLHMFCECNNILSFIVSLGVSITRKTTDFSYQVIMSIPSVAKSHISKYACRADTTVEDGTVEQEMDLLVQGII